MDKVEEAESRQQSGNLSQGDQKKKTKDFRNGIIVGVLITALILTGAYAGKTAYQIIKIKGAAAEAASESVVNTETIQKIKLLESVIDEVYYYGDNVSIDDLQEGVYKGLVYALGDPYSEYYTKEELEEVVNSNKGVAYGIGAYISLNKQWNMAMINNVMEESPAQEAGLMAGDVIIEVDGESTQGMSVSQVVSLVKGREGTTVCLTIYREGEADYLEINAVRGKLIEATTVNSGMLEGTDHIGYLRIIEFDGVTVDQYAEAMAVLKEEGMKALVLDLRSNPGGDVNAVVEIARKILPKGMIVYTEDKYGNRKEYTCDGDKKFDLPLVVLVNEYSASASEILAGAVQDYEMGTLIGTTTYGKGIVQQIQRLEDGTAIKLTISAYYTPLGRNIHGIGITPDIELEYDYDAYEAEGIDNQVEKAIEILEEQIR